MGNTIGYAYEGVFERNYKKWSGRRQRNYNEFNEGDKVIYCSCPLPSDAITNIPRSNVDRVPAQLVEYEGHVIQKTPYHLTMEILPIEGQIAYFSKPKPYKISIQSVDVGVTELLRRGKEG